jgi:hypothetical protein
MLFLTAKGFNGAGLYPAFFILKVIHPRGFRGIRQDGLPAVAVSAAATTVSAVTAGFVHRFVYTELAAFEFVTVGPGDGCGCFFISAHFDKSKTFGVAGFAIEDDLGGGYIAEL